MAGKTTTGIVPAGDLPKKPQAAGEREKQPGVNVVPGRTDDTKDALGRAKDPEAPRGEQPHRAGDHRRSGFGAGEEGEKVREAAEIGDKPRMSLGFAEKPRGHHGVSNEELLELVVEELRSSSFGFNKRLEKLYSEKQLEKRKEDAKERKAA